MIFHLSVMDLFFLSKVVFEERISSKGKKK